MTKLADLKKLLLPSAELPRRARIAFLVADLCTAIATMAFVHLWLTDGSTFYMLLALWNGLSLAACRALAHARDRSAERGLDPVQHGAAGAERLER